MSEEKEKLPECPAAYCLQGQVARYGQRVFRSSYHGNKPTCQWCGGVWDGERWVHQCHACKKPLEAGQLVGLFVPHQCRDCEKKIADAERAAGNVCLMCNKPRSRCYC